jgi:isoleucyl-tRNA synthetase
VHPDFKYVKVHDIERNRNFILLEKRLVMLYKDPKKALNKKYKVIETYTGSGLEGWEYEPLFDYFRSTFGEVAFRVLNDTYVTDEDGTGIVHQAPAFGEDDYRVSWRYGIISDARPPPCPIDEGGIYTSEVGDYAGQYVKDADKAIQKDLKHRGRLIVQSQLTHSYPFCWRLALVAMGHLTIGLTRPYYTALYLPGLSESPITSTKCSKLLVKQNGLHRSSDI